MADPKVIITIQAQDKASGEIQQITSGVVSNLTKMEQAGSSMSGSFSRLQGVIAAFGASLSVAGISQFAKSIWDTGAKIESMELAFKSITGTASGSAAEMEFVRQTAVKLGLDLTSAAQGYKTIAAAAMNTSLQGKGARDVFVAMSEASAALGLTSYQTEKALLALSQMLSKGKVGSEELRLQLGDALPGAMNLAAKAAGVTVAQFHEMLAEGKVLSDDFLPKFAKVLHDTFGVEAQNRANTFQGASNQMASAWTELKNSLADTRVFEVARSFVIRLADATTILADKIRSIDLSNVSGTATTFYKKVSGGAEFQFPVLKDIASPESKDLTKFNQFWNWQLGEWSKAPKKTGGGGGGRSSSASSVLALEDMTKKVETFGDKLTGMYADLESSNYDLWISMAKSSGDYYKAADLEVDKWVSTKKAGIDKSLSDAQAYFAEMEKNLTTKGGTAEAWTALEEARAKLAETESVAMQQYITLSDQETQKRADSVKALKDEEQQLKKTGSAWDGFRDSWNRWSEDASNSYKRGEELFDALESGLDDLSDSLAEFTIKGSSDWKSMLESMAEKAASFLYDSAFTDLLNAFKGSTSSSNSSLWGALAGGLIDLFGGGGNTVNTPSTFGSSMFTTGWSHHAGGLAGASGGVSRVMPSSLFAGAPRLHSGLNPDEFPAILQRGETVIPAGQSAASQTISTTINVSVNQQGKYDQSESQRLGSELSRAIEAEFNKNLQKQLRPGGILNRGVNG